MNKNSFEEIAAYVKYTHCISEEGIGKIYYTIGVYRLETNYGYFTFNDEDIDIFLSKQKRITILERLNTEVK